MTPVNWYDRTVLAVTAAVVRVMYGAPLVAIEVEVAVNPVAPDWLVSVVDANDVARPVGIVQPAPLAVVQYWNLIDPMLVLPTEGTVNVNKCLTDTPGADPPFAPLACSVKLRVVI